MTSGHINTIGFLWDTIDGLGSKYRLDADGFNIFISSNLLGHFTGNELIVFEVAWNHCCGIAAGNTLDELDTSLLSFRFEDLKAWVFSIFISGEDVLSHIDETTGKITRVGSTKSGRNLTLTSTTSCNEGFEGIKTILVAGLDWKLDFLVVNVDHDTNSCRSKLNTRNGTTSTGVSHHGNVGIHSSKLLLEEAGDFTVDFTPVSNG